MSHRKSPTASGSVAAFQAYLGNSFAWVTDLRDGQKVSRKLPFGLDRDPGQLQFRSNQLQYPWASILCHLLRSDLPSRPYRLGALYLEYANTGDTEVSPPTGFGRDENLNYYSDLSLLDDRDYLRVPIQASTVSSSNEELFPDGDTLSIWAISSGVAGAHGLEFSAAAGSRLYGAALISTPSYGDASQDLVFSRYYFPEDEQLRKLDGSELGIAWPVQFT